MIGIKISEEVENAEAMVDLLNEIATKVKEGYTSGYYPHWEITPADEEPVMISCACMDGSCSGKRGAEGEVNRHIENCDCSHCHREMGSVR